MNPSESSFERLDLRFRVAPEASGRFSLPGGLAIWLLGSCAVAVAIVLLSPIILKTHYESQLKRSQSPGEALLAIHGILALDSDAYGPIVQTLAANNTDVAYVAFRSLEQQIDIAAKGDRSTCLQHYLVIARNLEKLAKELPNDQRMLADNLASKMMSFSMDGGDAVDKRLYEMCAKLVGGSTNEPETIYSATAQRRSIASDQIARQVPPPPLPSSSASATGIRDIPQTSLNDQAGDSHNASGSSNGVASRLSDDDASQPEAISSGNASMQLVVAPTRPRSANLVSARIVRSLNEAADNMPNEDMMQKSPNQLLRPTAAVVVHQNRQAPVDEQSLLGRIAQLPIEDLVKLLSNKSPRVAQAATLALKAKGMADDKLELAALLATSDASQRIAILRQIEINQEFDPRPWLLWMAESGEPDVRRHAISSLSSMLDPGVSNRLRQLQAVESDPAVAQSLSEVLAISSQSLR